MGNRFIGSRFKFFTFPLNIDKPSVFPSLDVSYMICMPIQMPSIGFPVSFRYVSKPLFGAVA